ncbi:MAG: translation initiation factor [Planctomycetaceae bacterium]|nr:translation initiation factor [Planctomycetaceae bacterium]
MRLFEGTEFDRPPRCEQCGELEAECKCPPPEPVYKPPHKQTARIIVEKRQRGKQVTVVRGLMAADNDLGALLTELKSHCGAGGTLRGDEIEIQGDQSQRVRDALSRRGYRVR